MFAFGQRDVSGFATLELELFRNISKFFTAAMESERNGGNARRNRIGMALGSLFTGIQWTRNPPI